MSLAAVLAAHPASGAALLEAAIEALSKAAADCALDFGDPGAGALFFAGDGGLNRRRAQAFARTAAASARRFRLIAQTPAGAEFAQIAALLAARGGAGQAGDLSPFWELASRAYAAAARGEAFAFCAGAHPNALFSAVELPMLLANAHVSAVNAIPRADLMTLHAQDSDAALNALALAQARLRGAVLDGADAAILSDTIADQLARQGRPRHLAETALPLWRRSALAEAAFVAPRFAVRLPDAPGAALGLDLRPGFAGW